MATSQTNLKTEEQSDIDTRTPWQKAEYERRRISYRKEFKNLCLKHIQFLKRKEALIDFNRLFDVWQLYIKYKKLETLALLKYITVNVGNSSTTQQDKLKKTNELLTQGNVNNTDILFCIDVLLEQSDLNSKSTHANICLLEQQIADIKYGLQEIKNKNDLLTGSLLKFTGEYTDKPELTAKDFVNVLREDGPYLQIDGKIISTLAEAIKINLMNDAHKIELKMHIINGNIQELEMTAQMDILENRKNTIVQQKTKQQEFNDYLQAKRVIINNIADSRELQATQIDIKNYLQTLQAYYAENQRMVTEIDIEQHISVFDHDMLQLSLLAAQELAELNTFAYRAFLQQENVFKRNYKRNQPQNTDIMTDLARKLMDIREYKDEKHNKIRADFTLSKNILTKKINTERTTEEFAELSTKHKARFDIKEQEFISIPQDIMLPVPPSPDESKFGLEQERNEVIVAIAQTICESLGRLAFAASVREKPKTPQEHAGLLHLDNRSIIDVLHKHQATEEKAVINLGQTGKEICQLGKEINQLIRGLE